MSQAWLYFKLGLEHVSHIHAYNHVMFFIALMITITNNHNSNI